MKLPKWSVIPVATIAIMLGVTAVALVSGCIADGAVAWSNKMICETNGGLWLDEYNDCCPKGCPEEPIDFPITAQEQAIAERCNSCWLL
jgi:hypothetical protein